MKNICIYYIMGEEFVVPLAYTYCYSKYGRILYKKPFSKNKIYNILKTKITYIPVTFLIILYIIAFTNCELLVTYRTLFHIATKMMNTSREYSTKITWVLSIFIMCHTSM
jgi:hypothetical protein